MLSRLIQTWHEVFPGLLDCKTKKLRWLSRLCLDIKKTVCCLTLPNFKTELMTSLCIANLVRLL